jgi:hypothetical protein
VTLIAAVIDTDSRLLVQGTDPTGRVIADEPAGALWLAEPLPARTSDLLQDGMNYLKLRGRVSPPGGYGTDGRYLYQFSAETASIIVPEVTTLPIVADNLRSLEGALLRITGILLIGEGGTLMVERVTSGGVPPANARQVKIRDLATAQVPSHLEQRGNVRFGEVTTTGWLQDGVLTPFEVR